MLAARNGSSTVFEGAPAMKASQRKPSQRRRDGRTAASKALVLAVLAATASLAATSTPAMAAMISQVHTGDKDISTLVLRGQIVAGDLGRLQRVTAKIPPGQRIALMLDSPGGSIDEGIAIGRYVYAAKITTVAIQGPGCHSSCTLVFLAGRDASEQPMRIMMKGARVGFHQATLSTVPANQTYSASDIQTATQIGQEMVKRVNTYFQEIKADPEFLTLMLSAPNRSITLLNEFDALRLGIYVMDTATQKLTTPADLKR
jgi:hypothetical protein